MGLSAKVGPICQSIPGMQCSQTNNSSIYKPSMGHNSTLYLFLLTQMQNVEYHICVLGTFHK